MPAGHIDLLDGIHGNRREGLRAQEIVAVGKILRCWKPNLSGQALREKVATEVGGKRLSEVRAKSTVGNGTPALLTSSSKKGR
jgi:hypothetical protein